MRAFALLLYGVGTVAGPRIGRGAQADNRLIPGISDALAYGLYLRSMALIFQMMGRMLCSARKTMRS